MAPIVRRVAFRSPAAYLESERNSTEPSRSARSPSFRHCFAMTPPAKRSCVSLGPARGEGSALLPGGTEGAQLLIVRVRDSVDRPIARSGCRKVEERKTIEHR